MRRLLVTLLAFSVVAVSNPLTFLGQEPVTAANLRFNPQVPTMWHRLGVPQSVGRFRMFRDSRVNRKGNNPQRERKPKLLKLTDPRNLAPEAPKMMQAAAKIKQAEDLAPQKLKALKYLGTIGCGCYNKQNADMVEGALLEALADCTPEVRREAMKVILKQVSGGCPCSCSPPCNPKSCCTPKLYKALEKMANGQDDTCCPLESDPSLRALASQVLNACPYPIETAEDEPEVVEEEKIPPKLDEGGEMSGDEGFDDFEGIDPADEDAFDQGIDGEGNDINNPDDDLIVPIDGGGIGRQLNNRRDPNGNASRGNRRVATEQVSFRNGSSRLPGNRSLSSYSAADREFMKQLEVTGVIRSVRVEEGTVTIVFDDPYEFPEGLNVVIATDRNHVSFGDVEITRTGTAVIKVEDFSVLKNFKRLQRIRLGVFQ